MKKILNYISYGNGIGKRYMLALAVIASLCFAFYMHKETVNFIPEAQSIADQLLPIKVENGVMVEPANTVKVAKFSIDTNMNGNGEPLFPIVLDTRTDTLDPSTLSQGIYISRTTVYTVNKNEVRMVKLSNSFELPKADYTEFLKSSIDWMIVFFTFTSILVLFIYYLALTWFYALCSYAISALLSRKIEFKARMRVSAVAMITTYALLTLLNFANLYSNRWVFFIIVIALQAVLIKIMPTTPQVATETSAVAEEPSENKTEEK